MTDWERDARVSAAVEALRDTFGRAEIVHTGGNCWVIEVPVEGLGSFTVGDESGPLGETGHGFGAELRDTGGEWVKSVMRCADSDPDVLVDALRAYLRDGTRAGLTQADAPCERRGEHHA